MTMYHANSLEDIAKYFDTFVESAHRRVQNDKLTVIERKLAAREAYCWAEATRIVRATTLQLTKQFQDALGTAETGEALVEVARNAHRTEQELAALLRTRVNTGLE